MHLRPQLSDRCLVTRPVFESFRWLAGFAIRRPPFQDGALPKWYMWGSEGHDYNRFWRPTARSTRQIFATKLVDCPEALDISTRVDTVDKQLSLLLSHEVFRGATRSHYCRRHFLVDRCTGTSNSNEAKSVQFEMGSVLQSQWKDGGPCQGLRLLRHKESQEIHIMACTTGYCTRRATRKEEKGRRVARSAKRKYSFSPNIRPIT